MGEDELNLEPTNDVVDDGIASGDDGLSAGEQFAQSQQPQQQQQAPAQQSQQSQWDGSQFQLNYRGQMVAPKSREELINLAQKGYSYSQAMEQLKRERQEWEQQRTAQSDLYEKYNKFDTMLKSNPKLTQHLMQQIAAFNQQNAGQAGQQGYQQASLPPELMTRLQNLEQTIQVREQQAADAQLDQEVQSLRNKYPNYAWDGDNGLEQQLLQFAYHNNFNSLDHAFRVMMFDQMTTEQRAAGMKQVQQQRRQGIVQQGQPKAGTNGQQGKVGYKHGDSYQDLAAKMAAEISG